MVRILTLLGVTAALGAIAAPAPAAPPSRTVAVVRLLGARVGAVRRSDGAIPVLLPDSMQLGGPYYTTSSASPGRYNLEIDSQPGCMMANVCLLADFYAQRLGKPQRGALFGTPLTLHGGVRGAFASIQCGAACTPAEVDWIEFGTKYSLQANPWQAERPGAPPGALKAALVAAANQAIAAGPR